MEFEEMKVYNLEHPVDGWGAKKVDEFLLKSDVDEFASEQQLFYNDLEKRMGKTIAEKESRIKELEADNEAVKYAALCHCDENDRLNKQLENAENTYYSIKGELDNAKARIKEFRYNIAMAKAYGWKYTYTNCDTYGFWLRNKKKDYKTYRQQWLRIAEALEAKANKIKEEK